MKRQEDERIAEQQRASDEATRRARTAQEDEAQRRADADRQRMQAEVAAAQEAKARAEADAQRQAAMLQNSRLAIRLPRRLSKPHYPLNRPRMPKHGLNKAQQLAAHLSVRSRNFAQAPAAIQSHSGNQGHCPRLGCQYRRRSFRHREIPLWAAPARGPSQKLPGLFGLAGAGLKRKRKRRTHSSSSPAFKKNLAKQSAADFVSLGR